MSAFWKKKKYFNVPLDGKDPQYTELERDPFYTVFIYLLLIIKRAAKWLHNAPLHFHTLLLYLNLFIRASFVVFIKKWEGKFVLTSHGNTNLCTKLIILSIFKIPSRLKVKLSVSHCNVYPSSNNEFSPILWYRITINANFMKCKCHLLSKLF